MVKLTQMQRQSVFQSQNTGGGILSQVNSCTELSVKSEEHLLEEMLEEEVFHEVKSKTSLSRRISEMSNDFPGKIELNIETENARKSSITIDTFGNVDMSGVFRGRSDTIETSFTTTEFNEKSENEY